MKRFNCDFGSRFRILKGGKISLIVSALLGSAMIASASPTGGTVTSGTANISQSGNTTNITQSSNKASINWQDFSIKSNETVNFKQPNVNSITLNRVVGNERSIIDGALNANGQVWILNSNGILFNNTAKINTAGILATTKNITDADFNAGNYKFTGNSTAGVINMGTIEASDSGYVALLANTVQNNGTIKAYKGTVHLTGASEATINLNGNSIVSLTVNKGVLDALVENKGAVLADGGKIYLTTNAVNEILKGVVNNTGLIEANSLDGLTSKVELFAHGGTANVSGTIEAIGGFVETSGDKVKVNNDFRVKANKWLIDPVDFTVAASGGDIDGATLSSNLESASVEIQSANGSVGTNGDIIVNDAITWSSDNTLTLNAYRNIAINADITATGASGKLSLLYGQGSANGGANDNYTLASGVKVNLQSGQNFSTRKGTTVGNLKDYTVITTLGAQGSTTQTDLQGMKGNLTKNYVLGTDIDASGTSTWNSGAGFDPIGVWSTKFQGIFDGLGHKIDGLTINRPANATDTGLFGTTDTNSIIQNIGLTNVSIVGNANTGALVGVLLGSVFNSYSTGNVSGVRQVGGLIGNLQSGGRLSNSYSTSTVAATDATVGGLVGFNMGSISNSYTTGRVIGNVGITQVGGFVGYSNGTISNSYAAAIMDAYANGGFIGTYAGGSVTNSFWDTTKTTISGLNEYSAATGITTEQFADASNFSTWGSSVWSFKDSSFAGYGIASRPFLTNVTTNADKSLITLFNGGYGTSDSPYTITTATQLQNMNNTNVVGQRYYYNLVNNINLAGVTWTPIGKSNVGLNFDGVFDGQNHEIDHLTIASSPYANQGLFGVTYTNAIIKNIGLTNVDLVGGGASGSSTPIGALAGYARCLIENVYVTGTVSSIGNYVGGLVGINAGIISNSYADVDVTGNNHVGGLIGQNNGGIINNSYSKGSVQGVNNVGGFVGSSWMSSRISNSYSTASVDGTNYVGGFVGDLDTNNNGFITNSYATGNVVSSNNKGGFAGKIGSTINVSNSFWNKTTTGMETDIVASGTTGLTTAQMKDMNNYSAWDIASITASTGTAYPQLRWATTTGNTGTSVWVYNADANSGGGSGSSPTPNPTVTPESTVTPNPTNNINVNKVITSIVNTNVLKVEVAKITQPIIQPQVVKTTINPNIDIGFSEGTNVTLVSQPKNDEPTKMITMTQLKSMQKNESQETNTNTVNDVRVSVGDNSVIDLINGGVNLPLGVEQEFYVVKENENQKN